MSLSEDSKLKIAIFLLPLVFSAGIVIATLTTSTEAVEAEIEEVKEGLKVHSALKAHPVTEERINTIMLEQRALRVEVGEANENISAICSAIPGARCK